MFIIPYGYCQCGCGKQTNTAKISDKKRGIIKGKPFRFIFNHHKRVITPEHRVLSKINKINNGDDHWRWIGTIEKKNGYGVIGINGKNLRAHRVVWSMYFGSIPEGALVLHKCDTPWCVNPKHLYIGTPADNMHDKHNRKRDGFSLHPEKYQERRTTAKLDWNKANTIRRLVLIDHISHRQIAATFAISTSMVKNIITNKSWKER